MKILLAGGLLTALLIVTDGTALASELSVPNSFTSGSRALAAEVNANFDATEAAVNDNDARITTNEAMIGDNGAALMQEMMADGIAAAPSTNSSRALNATDTVVRSLSVTPPLDGVVVVGFQAWFNCSSSAACVARCSINPGGTTLDTTQFTLTSVSSQQYGTLAINSAFAAAGNQALELNAVCDTFAGSGTIGDMALTAVFSAKDITTPTP